MAADNQIIIEIDLDQKNINDTYSKIEVTAEKTAVSVEQSFNQSIAKINTETLEKVNESLGTLNENIIANTKASAANSDALSKNSDVLSKIAKAADFVVSNIDSVIFVLEKTGKISDETAEKTTGLVDSLKDFGLNQEAFDKLKDALSAILKPGLALSLAVNLLGNRFGRLLLEIGGFSAIFDKIKQAIIAAGGALVFAGGAIVKFKKQLIDVGKLGFGVTKVFFSGTQNIFGFTTALAASATGLLALGGILKQADSQLVRFVGSLSTTASILLGGLATAITLAIVSVGRFAKNVGTTLVEAFQRASKEFVKGERNLIIFNETVKAFNRISKGGSRSTKEWAAQIEGLSNVLNIGSNSLRKAGAEILAVGTRIGLTQRQQKSLLDVTAEYAKITGKDVFDASVAFVSGLNGQSQALLSYGVKLTEASNQQFILKQGLTDNFRTLSESEKVQVRFNNLLKQYSDVAGLGAAAAGSMAEQSDKLQLNIARLNGALGKGAAIIEENNIGAFAFNLILNNLNQTVLAVGGFFGALGARILQFGGALLEVSFVIFAVTKGFKILKLLLASDIFIGAFAKQIPILNVSMNELIGNIGNLNREIKSVKDIFPIAANIIKAQLKAVGNAFIFATKQAVRFLISIAPLLIKAALIAAAIKFVVDAFKEFEERTGALSDTWNALVDAFGETSVFDDFRDIFQEIGNFLLNVFNKGLAVTIVGISLLIGAFAKLVKANPFGTFSEKTVESFTAIDEKLGTFRAQVIASGFDLRNLGERGIASAAAIDGAFKAVNLQTLADLREALKNVGKTDLQLLQEERDFRVDLINRSLQQELIALEDFENLKQKILEDFANKRLDLQKKEVDVGKSINEQYRRTLASVVKQGVASIGASLVQGSSAFENFGKSVLGIVGDLLINIGFALTGIGKAIEALKVSLSSLSGGVAIAAGFGLIVLGGLLKSLGTGGIGVAGGGTAIGASGGPDQDGVIIGSEVDDIEEKITQVNIDVSGQVLNPAEVGNQLAEVINEAFEAGGTKVLTA